MLCLKTLAQTRRTSSGLFGILNSVADPVIVEMIATAGFDYLILDQEHLPHNETLLSHCIQIAQQHHCTPLVRVNVADIARVGRILDLGAHGIVLSRTESVQEIIALRDAMFFPPLGKRGITGGRVTGFGTLPLADYIQEVNTKLWLIPMIESPEGINALADILTIPEITMVMEGALDLALTMGVGPDPLHDEVTRQVQAMATICRAAKIPFFANPRSKQQQQYWQAQGIEHWFCGEDRGLLYRALKKQLHEIQACSQR
jgi:4-hydroxy-2-oxoheptanedioate aldolase